METWSSSVCRGKGFALDESFSASPDVIAVEKNGMVCRELKYPFGCGFENNLLHMNSTQEPIESPGFVGLGTSDIIREASSTDSVRDKFDGGTMLNSVVAGTKAVPQEHKSSSKLSVSESSCCCHESSFVDLKLGRIADHKDVQNYNFSRTLTNLSTTMPAKRVRPGNLSANTSFCQVYGCDKDLSSYKDYHRRHKVCEVHSKTAKVIVNGIEQRFCQQCSRFHLLAEFDDSKRSCRKRLAGHNERRRKPREVSSFHGNAFTSSFICQETLRSSLLHQQKDGTNDYCKNLKLNEVSDYRQESAISIANGHLHSRSPFYTHGFEKQYPVQENRVCTPWGSKFGENGYLFPHLEGSNFSSHSVYPNLLIGCDAFTVLDSASHAQGLSDSDCALSLQSSQSENSLASSVTHCLLIPGSNAPFNVTETSGRVLGVRSDASASVISSKFY